MERNPETQPHQEGRTLNSRSKQNPSAARNWCRKNYVNGKAAGIVLSTQNELLRQFGYAHKEFYYSRFNLKCY